VCAIFDVKCQAAQAAASGAESMLELLAEMIIDSLSTLIAMPCSSGRSG
jgi:hypothetical protein